MSKPSQPVFTFASLVALFIAGAWLATWFVSGPNQVTLIWPPAGIAIGALIVHGWRWWPFIPVAVVIFHLTLGPVPAAFIPFSIASNLVSALVAVAWVHYRAPGAVERLSMRSGFLFLGASTLAVLVGGVIGASGLVFAGMVPSANYFEAAWRWALGDLFGVVAVLSSVLIGYRWRAWPSEGPLPFRYAQRSEKWVWMAVFLLSLVVVAWVARRSGAYALGFASLPFVFVIWSAVRFEPPWTAFGTTIVGLYLATLIGLGYAGLAPPSDLGSTTILIAFLCMITAAPQIVAAAANENRAASMRALRRATVDRLTGLVNRPAFEDQARHAMRRHPQQAMALAYLDLDQFKLVNDTLSHRIGDELLQSLAAALASVIRPGDVFARLGGDEFALLLRDVDRTEAVRLAQELRRVVADFRFAHDGRVIAPTMSIGLVPFVPAASDFANLFAQADSACFTAKELGGNRVQVASADERHVHDRRNAMDWAVRIGEAIEQNRLRLFAQDIVPLKPVLDSQLRHFEVLLRIEDAVSGELLAPGPFIAAAERFRFATRIDRAVLTQTLDWLDAHPQHAEQVGMIGINLSGASVGDDEFAQFVEERVLASRFPAARVCFEITETSAVRDLGQAQRFIQRIRALGCKFALDDFGAGFCSFSYLQSLDVDYFKIDGSFVREVHQSPLALAIVRSIAEIARVMRKQTIAEYTESDTVRSHLMALGVDHAQGFAIARPMALADYFAPTDPLAAMRRAG
ncbi:MAG TPA: EAL domain-containing protein [Patescibacteria group bacterium]|nr:EAL domain-containing protein [Patescibacteria group bacterium]